MTPDLLAGDLARAARASGCGLCRLRTRWEAGRPAGFVREHWASANLRRRLRAAGGLCSGHTWALASYEEASFGQPTCFAGLAIELVGVWRAALWAGPPPARGRCVFCEAVELQEAIYTRKLLRLLAAGDERAGGLASGLCYRHMQRAVNRAPLSLARRLLSFARDGRRAPPSLDHPAAVAEHRAEAVVPTASNVTG